MEMKRKKRRLKILLLVFASLLFGCVNAQLKWQNVDSLFQPLPKNFHVYKSTDSLDGKPFIGYYAEAKLKDKKLNFTVDTTFKRRLTPQQFFQKNNQPLLVINGTFFSYESNKNLNLVVKDGKIVSYNLHTIPGRGKDTFTYRHPFASAIGIDKKGRADVAWIQADTGALIPYASQVVLPNFKDSANQLLLVRTLFDTTYLNNLSPWKIKTAIGGGPVLLQKGEIKITNNEELKFSIKTGLTDKHPRTAMGYTKDGRLIIMVIQGRFANIADGATLIQEAQLLKDLGCVEALNLDGGGSTCMLINGKEVFKPSDKEGQRPVPAVFLIQQKK
jgi:hypothetical protein